MTRLTTLISFFLVLLSGLNAQGKVDPIMAIKQDADSVWILSHEVTGVYIGYDDGKSKSEERVLFKAGKLDTSLVKETHLLTKTERSQLARLLARPNSETKIEMAKCFMPQHAIVCRKAGNVSWIEVCFSCQKIRGSKNLKSAIPELDNPKWAALRSLFKQMGMTYEL
jgi:hypothetical protein